MTPRCRRRTPAASPNPIRLPTARLAAVVRESSRAARLVDDLLTISRGQEGIALHRELMRMEDLVNQEVDRCRPLAPHLVWRTDSDAAVTIPGDPLRLGQVLTNLLDNARHATLAGGTITVTLRHDRATLTLDVSDTGPGVPVGDRERIFDRLVRLDPSRSRASGGAGLGLPIARAIACAHGGDLAALTGPGGHFRLTLPTRTDEITISMPEAGGIGREARLNHA